MIIGQIFVEVVSAYTFLHYIFKHSTNAKIQSTIKKVFFSSFIEISLKNLYEIFLIMFYMHVYR